MKRNRYDDAIPFHCNTCDIDFTVEGYVEPLRFPDFIIIPAESHGDMCPNDDGVRVASSGAFGGGSLLIPTHDTNYIGDER